MTPERIALTIVFCFLAVWLLAFGARLPGE
jgi:hypothetical protein